MKRNIKNISLAEVESFFQEKNYAKYRIKQITDAVYKQKKLSWDSISNISKEMKQQLEDDFELNSLELINKQISEDGSIKFLFHTNDKSLIETVYMPHKDVSNPRHTLCISTMTGCPINCVFCATGKIKHSRNLSIAEMLDQIFNVEAELKQALTNVVIMGMGEPLLNTDAVISVLSTLCNPERQLFSKRKITLSTVGIKDQIKKLADSKYPVKLAVSLHATTNDTRTQLIPYNKKYGIKEVLAEVEYYYQKTKLPISYEYIPIKDLNDTDLDIKRLIKICKRVPSKINIIPANDIKINQKNETFSSSKSNSTYMADRLKQNGVNATIRKSFGNDIDAACGQLAGQNTP